MKKVDSKINLSKQEEEVLSFWSENKIFEKSLARNQKGKKFVFYEGPPTANGKPGIHHVLARAFKDVILRYKTMKGYYVPRKAGWDTHGLPVELEVEKNIGISGKNQIESIVPQNKTASIEKFNEKCRQSVWKYQKDWEKLTERIFFWLDLSNPYITYDSKYIETLWWIVWQIDKKGLLYKGHKVVPYCPRCGTALSSHEVAQGYKDITETSLYVKFKIKGKDKQYLLAWTTTPWTLPGNVALAVNRNISYVKVRIKDEVYIIAEDRIAILGPDTKIIEKIKGKDLEGIKYQPLYEIEGGSNEQSHQVLLADFVTAKDGTGIVHTAVMYGEDDYLLGHKVGLPKNHTVNDEGKFFDNVKKWAGVFVKDANPKIISDLKKRKLLFKSEDITHSYPHCWRCNSPLLYYARDSWYIRMTKLKEKLLENNKKINWIPKHLKNGRFGDWLENINDWAISRNRYWGTPLPIWECTKCHKYKVVSSLDELGKDIEPHRPYVDEVKFTCVCGGEMKRVPEVMDCWFDSGAMPYAQHHYPFENVELFQSEFPADYIAEAIDQTRGWFYTLLAISTAVSNDTSYKNVISLGHILDEKGQKMSKSLGNIIDPWKVMNQYGADPLRYYMYTVNQPGEPKIFSDKGITTVTRNVFLTLWNVYSFFTTYALIDNFVPKKQNEFSNILDKWIIAKKNQLACDVLKYLDDYNIYDGAKAIESFINQLSTWYIRRSRRRFWKSKK